MAFDRRNSLMMALGDERKFVNGIQYVAEGIKQGVDGLALSLDALALSLDALALSLDALALPLDALALPRDAFTLPRNAFALPLDDGLEASHPGSHLGAQFPPARMEFRAARMQRFDVDALDDGAFM